MHQHHIEHSHIHGHSDCGHDLSKLHEKKLWWAVGANLLLTLAQIIGGLVSGSLSLIADALHNLGDATALFVAVIATRIARKPADSQNTFGYKRAETIAALINLTALMAIGVFLILEAVKRFFLPEPITGWIMIVIAVIALMVDLFTAAITYARSKESMNMRAAFLHNLTDALASVGVIVAGILILLYGWVWTDTLISLMIAGYILYHGAHDLPRVIHLLMDGTPDHINISNVIETLTAQDGVKDAHHVHIRNMNEETVALEAHILLDEDHASQLDIIKAALKKAIEDKHNITHSTLEFEITPCQE